ncbi:hypothetical protein [Anatilimnocola floriformis]|uniref:hypothetical protein n=1 Tax=Anatilimnocola floriformis TaxID=2948575 RepID=UPI0020C33330|nr:hypothetical protein [Anatilimnocola floriformis]
MRLGVMVVAGLAVLVAAAQAIAQPAISFPPSRNFPMGTSPAAAPPPSFGAVPSFTAPLQPAPGTAGPAINTINPGALGSPLPFDPYSPNGPASAQFWSSPSPPPALPNSVLPPNPNAPAYGSQWAPSVTGQPNSLYPNGFGGPNSGYYDPYNALRLINDVRFRDTYVTSGNNPDDLGINDAEVSVTFTFPNFLTLGQPLFITPAFAIHNWDGPSDGIHNLPGSAYSAYLDLQFATDPNLTIGGEFGFRVGVYSGFDTFTKDSVRFQGLALGVTRITPTLTAKLGVMYIDRNDIKILPAGGLLWQPNPQLRVDIFFPQPRISQYVTTVGTYELWWYLAGEYGGGAWTVKPTDADPTQGIDINDFRASLGLEWSSPAGLNGFIEGGYVFKRKLVYTAPYEEFSLNDAWMVRAGVSY